jgi:membrane complex biogenesis BtpA family protein
MSRRPVFRPRPDAIQSVFGRSHAVIGVIHCLPFPGAPEYEGRPVVEIAAHAVEEGRRYVEGGVDGLIVENHGDIPFAKPDQLGPETAACMAVTAAAVAGSCRVPIGINVLANAAHVALAVAKASGAQFVRVNQWANAYVANEGFMEGPAGSASRYRAVLHARDVRLFADVHVKHGAHAITADRTLAELARDVEFFGANGAIATGQRTGDSANLDELRAIAEGTTLPVLVGSGVNPANVGDMFSVARAVIVASSLKRDGVWWNEVDPDRLRSFMAEADRARPARSQDLCSTSSGQ